MFQSRHKFTHYFLNFQTISAKKSPTFIIIKTILFLSYTLEIIIDVMHNKKVGL